MNIKEFESLAKRTFETHRISPQFLDGCAAFLPIMFAIINSMRFLAECPCNDRAQCKECDEYGEGLAALMISFYDENKSISLPSESNEVHQ